MSQPEAWTTEEAERLGAIARGEQCPHLNVLEVWSYGDDEPVLVCTKCGDRVE